jgi:hypothetical protein
MLFSGLIFAKIAFHLIFHVFELYQVEYQMENGTIPSILPCISSKSGGSKSGRRF